ncbi:uncharacterized protein LOC122019055 [Zingiber officinale]|uniref:uncharacterized protein LOC122019055 n=1 Tax=Zingiber officinale TaxID=94328 RepID=UPI001C4BC474|nr:uncharacterized protein LOC122019055 [Zingiber officinale]
MVMMMIKTGSCKELLLSSLLLLLCSILNNVYGAEVAEVSGEISRLTCRNRASPCFLRLISCPRECPEVRPEDPRARACFLDCNSPKCETTCRGRKPNCNGVGSGCYDPRFVGRDGAIFFFHGEKDHNFALVSDIHLHINARFVGLRPAGRPRDFTWIRALGLLHGRHALTISATPTAHWTDDVDHLAFALDGEPFHLPVGHLSTWRSPDGTLTVERTGSRNSVAVAVGEVAEVMVNVVPVTAEDDKVHGYGIPSGDCFAHLEVQFSFYGLSPEVEGVLGRTYRPDFRSTAKVGVPMPMVGGEDEYRTSSLVAADCSRCIFAPVADD